jgi:hypothetical protein
MRVEPQWSLSLYHCICARRTCRKHKGGADRAAKKKGIPIPEGYGDIAARKAQNQKNIRIGAGDGIRTRDPLLGKSV